MNEHFSPFLKQYSELFFWLEWKYSKVSPSYIVNHIPGIATRVLPFLPFYINHVLRKDGQGREQLASRYHLLCFWQHCHMLPANQDEASY